jgi:nucleoside-triphosphatase THEP1
MPEKRIYIFTGAIQTGKTTSLAEWSGKRPDVFGILTPVVNGKRVFMNAHTLEQFPMEASAGEAQVLTVGRFIFSMANFEIAAQIIREAIQKEGWLVIDEIGPLELKEKGFSEVLKEAIAAANKKQNLLLVIRESLVKEVIEYFHINDHIPISIAELNKF